jgi:hypothetical protein
MKDVDARLAISTSAPEYPWQAAPTSIGTDALYAAYGARQVGKEPATGAETFARANDGHLRPAATSTPVTPRRVGVGPRR